MAGVERQYRRATCRVFLICVCLTRINVVFDVLAKMCYQMSMIDGCYSRIHRALPPRFNLFGEPSLI